MSKVKSVKSERCKDRKVTRVKSVKSEKCQEEKVSRVKKACQTTQTTTEFVTNELVETPKFCWPIVSKQSCEGGCNVIPKLFAAF